MYGWHLLLLWSLTLATYSNSFRGPAVFDGARLISQDARIRAATAQNLRLIVTEEYWYQSAPSGLYRPFTTFSFLANYAIFGNGSSPEGYHWVNFALHAINLSLLYALGLLILGEPGLALALAALWGLHPLLTDSVTNIAGRADLLAACGVLAGLLCYWRATSSDGRRRMAWMAGLVAAQTVGLFSKENAAVLPGLMLLTDLAWPNRVTGRARAFAYAALALPYGLFFWLRAQVHTNMWINPAENPLIAAGFWTARWTAVKVLGKFVWLFLWPAHLSADYSYNAVPLVTWSPVDIGALIALAICAGGLVLAVRWRHTWPAGFFFVLFFFIAILPTANLIFLIGSVMAERFVYLPSIGLAGSVVVACQACRGLQARRVAWTAFGLACLLCAARTYARNMDWRDAVAFWTATVDACPESARPHNNLGDTLATLPGRLPDAIAQFHTALRIRPDYADAHYNLANALARTPGDLPAAVSEYQSALRIEPGFAQAHLNLGTVLAQLPGRLADAIAEFQAAARADPDLADAHYNLGSTLAQLPGRLPDAIAELQIAVRLQPDNARAHNNLGSLWSRMPDRLPDAIAEFQTALRIQPDYVKAHINLGGALAQVPGRLPDAIVELETALRLQPDPEIQRLVDRLRAATR
jgi:tetratricopeptide (TPR) repeat protein